jgi:hypothetical protein
LVDLLGELWPRLGGAAKAATRREFAEGALSLGRTASALEALRAMLVDEPSDAWAASRLLSLLPNDDAHQHERLDLVSRLITHATGEARAELLARRAELHRLSADLLSARADLLEASQLSANPVPLLRALAELSRQSRDEAAELSALKLVLEHARGEPEVVTDAAERLVNIARNRAAANDTARALEAFEALVTLPLPTSERFEAWFGLAHVAQEAGNVRRAEEALLEASKHGAVAKRVEALLARAQLQEGRNAFEAAVTSYAAVLELAPRQAAATAGLISALRRLGDWEGLAEVLTLEANHLPKADAVPLFVELAALYLDRLGQSGPGEAALRRIIAIDEADVSARRRLASLLAARGEYTEAIALLEAAAEHLGSSEAAATLREAARWAALEEDGMLELKLMRQAHGFVPALGEDLQRLAESLYLNGAMREALPLQQALAASVSFHDAPDVAERVWLRLADLAEQLDQGALAEASLRRVVSERPLNGQAVNRLAALVSASDPRAGFELRARWTEGLSRSERSAQLLLELAREAASTHNDPDAAIRLYGKAAAASEAPLPLRMEVAQVLRTVGRTAELMTELAEIAQLELTSGHVDGALEAWAEEARLAEGSGRLDDALRTLSAMADICADEDRLDQAAALCVRRSELLADSKLDLGGAAQALERAWDFGPSLALARQGLALARRRSDRDGEIDWLERVLALLHGAEQAVAFVQLARLHLGLSAEGSGDVASAAMLAPDQAEAALDKALALAPGLAEAEGMLLALYERQDRVGDVAGYYEAAAGRAREPGQRAVLLLKAATLYKDRAGRPHDAAAALLAARAASPDDLSLTAQVADLLIELGRRQDAADFDAVLLESDPKHPCFPRHVAFLEETGDVLSLAAVLSRRAEASTGEDAGTLWLDAAAAFRHAGADERALVCEAQAFENAPGNRQAFEALFARAEGDPHRQAELLALRAKAEPADASALLRQRAELLTRSGEPLLAAAAWDEYLARIPDDLGALEARGTLAAAGGGARAAQSFDRRLMQLGGEGLSAATRLTLWSRLGLAAVESHAWRDAVDAFEAAWAIDPDSERGREALSMLNEAWARLGDVEGQYRTTMRLAERSHGAESEALYRRALALVDAPEQALGALEWLFQRHPTEISLYEKAQRAMTALGRVGELAQVHERFAAATGGSAASRALLAAAALVERELHEGQRAFELRQAAYEADPDNLDAAEAVLREARARSDVERLEAMLVRLAALTGDEERAVELKLELSLSLMNRGQFEAARVPLESIRRRGSSAGGYAQALEGLERIAIELTDPAALADVQTASAELLGAQERAARLLEAARSYLEAQQVDRAMALTSESLAARPSKAGYAQLVELARISGRPADLAKALTQLAEQSSGVERGAMLLQALAAWREAGELDQAREVLERVLRECPGLVTAADAGQHFVVLKAPKRALEVAWAPAMRAARHVEALALAEGAGDEAKQLEVLQVLALEDPRGEHAERYLARLRASRDVAGLRQFAEQLAPSAPALALALQAELCLDFTQVDLVELLMRSASGEALVASAIERRAAEVLVAALGQADALAPGPRQALFESVGALVPSRRASMARELATLHREAGQFQEAHQALLALCALEQGASARAALDIERGELLLHQLGDKDLAQAAFERALAFDARQLAAVRELVELYRDGEPSRFASMVERLGDLAGAEALAPWRERLADAYQALGRHRDAYNLLGQLEESPARIRRRVALAQALELQGEALALAEKVADTRVEFERILEGYLRAELVPFAVRLGGRLLDEGPLPQALLRLLAERLAPTLQGAALAAQAWPMLLAERLDDVDGWTLYAEALRKLNREASAVLADGFGAALSGSTGVAPMVRPMALEWAPTALAVPEGALAVTPSSMPRLAAALAETLADLGAESLATMLHVEGGVGAFLAGKVLVLGAGALTVFGQAELPALVALALALGEHGVGLEGTGDVTEFVPAARHAFGAYPASLAFCRVLAQLDPSVRGGDPALVDVATVLRGSAAFHAVALAALESLRERQ